MFRPILALGLLCVFAPLPALAVPTVHMDNSSVTNNGAFASDPQGAIRAARERVAAGDLDGAVKGLELYVAAHPDDLAPKRFLGDLYFRQHRLGDAERVYTQILAGAPKDRETHNRLGTVYAIEGRVDQAISEFDASLPGTDSVPDLVALHERKGDLGDYKAKMIVLATGNPESADIQAELGQIYEALHEPASAALQYMKALRLDPQSLTGLNGLGLAYLDLHDYRNAEGQFRTCLTIDPFNYSCMDNLGAAQLESGELSGAELSIDAAHRLAPERPEALVNFGFLADSRGDWRKAVTYYAKAISVFPYSREAYIDLGITYEQHKLYALAQEALTKGVAAAPDDGRIHYLLGRAYEAQGQGDLAAAQYKAAMHSFDPDVVRIAQERLLAAQQHPIPHNTK